MTLRGIELRYVLAMQLAVHGPATKAAGVTQPLGHCRSDAARATTPVARRPWRGAEWRASPTASLTPRSDTPCPTRSAGAWDATGRSRVCGAAARDTHAGSVFRWRTRGPTPL